MNLHRMLAAREAEKRPVRVVLVGAGKFGSMYLSQAQRTPGIHAALGRRTASGAMAVRWSGPVNT